MFEAKISEAARNAIELLKNNLPPKSYLAGGTALALQIGYRQSYDLDLYTLSDFNEETLQKEVLKVSKDILVKSSAWKSVFFTYMDTEISIFYYPYEMLSDFVDYHKFNLASIKDICAMKIQAISGLGLKRDFFDVYSICQYLKISVYEAVLLNQNKYKTDATNLPHIVNSLDYFTDAETAYDRANISDKDWQLVRAFFKKENRGLINKF